MPARLPFTAAHLRIRYHPINVRIVELGSIGFTSGLDILSIFDSILFASCVMRYHNHYPVQPRTHHHSFTCTFFCPSPTFKPNFVRCSLPPSSLNTVFSRSPLSPAAQLAAVRNGEVLLKRATGRSAFENEGGDEVLHFFLQRHMRTGRGQNIPIQLHPCAQSPDGDGDREYQCQC